MYIHLYYLATIYRSRVGVVTGVQMKWLPGSSVHLFPDCTLFTSHYQLLGICLLIKFNTLFHRTFNAMAESQHKLVRDMAIS